MKSTPILMKPAMASATLADIKTHTRRIAKLPTGWSIPPAKVEGGFLNRYGSHSDELIACPYGGPGDQLWVREEHYRFGHWEPVKGVKTKGGRQKWSFVADRADCIFDAPLAEYGEPMHYRVSRDAKEPARKQWYKRLARFMPRALSRITLEITEVRIERLNDISADDCRAEGHPKSDRPLSKEAHDDAARDWYMDLWESINGAGSWAKNPLVWVIVFRRIKN